VGNFAAADMKFKRLQKNWEGLGSKDPMWAVLTNPLKKGKKWDSVSFYSSGEYEVKILLSLLTKRNITLPDKTTALDFGCGLGRLSRGLGSRFDKVTGIDISSSMINKAKDENKAYRNLQFICNPTDDLSILSSHQYSFLLSVITLQHIPAPFSHQYIREFMRVLKKDGIAMIQIPSQDLRDYTPLQKFRRWVRIRERLALLGLGKGYTMEMFVVSESEVTKLIHDNGGTLLAKYYTNHTDPSYDGKLIASFDENLFTGFVSTLYIVQKN